MQENKILGNDCSLLNFSDSVNVGVKVEGIQGETKIRICEIGYQNFEVI